MSYENLKPNSCATPSAVRTARERERKKQQRPKHENKNVMLGLWIAKRGRREMRSVGARRYPENCEDSIF